jgi:4-hydroxy-tetrahydrodipicolinate reductase
MQAIILGDGAMGQAIVFALRGRGDTVLDVLGVPRPAGRTMASRPSVTFDFSVGNAVRANTVDVLATGCRRLVIGTTAWEADRAAVDAALVSAGAAAVASPSFSLGIALFGRLVEEAARLFGTIVDYDPYIVEWHRRTKPDRPSGTAKELSRRLLAAHPRKRRIAEAGRAGGPAVDELEVVAIRAGASPGMHLVGFDAPGESVELRLTARDRSAYVAGALAAADWLLAAPRTPGLHRFEEVVDGLLVDGRLATSAPTERTNDTGPAEPVVAAMAPVRHGTATPRGALP